MNDGPLPLDADLEIRSLRAFVAVAEELHFTRAAARLFVAQQALSREIRSLERRLGTPLFVRTTRRVTLTPEGERLLEPARELVALHDRIRAGIRALDDRPVVVDLLSDGRLTGARLLERARSSAPEVEFRGRYGGAAGAALDRLVAGMLDVVIGRCDWRQQLPLPGIDRRLIRLEPLALLLPLGHPLAELDAVPLAVLRDVEIDANAATDAAREWIDLVEQFLALTGARPTAPHIAAIGLEEQVDHLVRQGLPILTAVDHVAVPGGVVRPLVDPVPLYPWSIAWRSGARGAGVAALLEAADSLGTAEGWLEPAREAGPGGATWLPEPDASQLRQAAGA